MSAQGIDIKLNNKAHRIPYPVRKRLFNLKEAAEYLGRPVWGIRELIWNQKIPYIQDGRKYYVDVQDMDAYIERQKVSFL
jgi:excisionase family DNA binding protein